MSSNQYPFMVELYFSGSSSFSISISSSNTNTKTYVAPLARDQVFTSLSSGFQLVL